MKVLKQIQQGDVWIEQIDSLEGLEFRDKQFRQISPEAVRSALSLSTPLSKHTLAYGEATGHHHSLVIDESAVSNPQAIQVMMDEGIFQLMEQAILTHDEHKPLVLEPGLYRFGIINEYDYESKQNRRVWD